MGARRAKGSGYLINNIDGTVTLRKSITDPHTGHQKRIQVTAKTETACIRKMNERLEELKRTNYRISASPEMTVTALCKNHLNLQYDQGLIKRTSKDRNAVTIKNQIEPFPLGHMQIRSVTGKDIDEHFTKLILDGKLSVSTLEKVKYVLDSAFSWAVQRRELSSNPVEEVQEILTMKFSRLRSKGANDEDVRILSSIEERLILEKSVETWGNGKYKYPGGLHFRFLLHTGMRVGEYICLRWEDYNPKNRILKIDKCRHQVRAGDNEECETNYVALEGSTKNSKARNIELTNEAAAILKEINDLTPWKSPTDYIALTRAGRNYTATSMAHVVETIYRNADVNEVVSGLHILRRTFATKLFQEGYSVKEVAAYLGDEEATVSKYYIAARETREVDGKRIAVVTLKKKK